MAHFTMIKGYCYIFYLFLITTFYFSPINLAAAENIMLSKGQTIYVPAYSHIYSGARETPFSLTITLSIRNIDPKQQISITAVDFYETQGRLVKKYLKKPYLLKPLESIRYVIAKKEDAGGSGANFIVEWNSKKCTNPPIVESIMIGTQSQQGVSFTSRGRVLITSE